jgi:hypothetical protein
MRRDMQKSTQLIPKAIVLLLKLIPKCVIGISSQIDSQYYSYECDQWVANDNRWKHIQKLRKLLEQAQTEEYDSEDQESIQKFQLSAEE